MIVEAVVDPFEPPMPSKVSREQATTFAWSLARGESNWEQIALTIVADKVRELIEGCDKFHDFGVAHAAWADTGLPRSAKPGGPQEVDVSGMALQFSFNQHQSGQSSRAGNEGIGSDR